jgi:diguanylate cyclase (GGDEF)-like protein
LKRIILPGLILYCIAAGAGLFLGPGLSSLFLFPWIAGYLFLVFAVSFLSLFTKERSLGFEFIILGVIGLNFIVQMTGGMGSPFHAAYFLLAAAAAFQPGWRAYYVAALILVIEAGNLFRVEHDTALRWQSYAGFAVALAGVVFITTSFMGRIRNHARIVRERYEKLLADADAVDPLAGDLKPEALSEQNRQAANVSTAVEREGAFKGLIGMIYEMVPAHTYALFLAAREDGAFVLRAIRSQSRHLEPVGTTKVSKGSGLIGICIDKNQPQYLPDMVIPAKKLGYYTHDVPVKSFLAIPVAQGERTAGVLIVDSLERDAFSPDSQDLLTRFAPFFSEIIEKIRITQELDLRAKNFAALHDMSSILNSSLDIGEVLDRLSSQIKSVVPYDFCAFLLYDEQSNNAVVTALRGYDVHLIGSRFPIEQSAIMSHMLKQWRDRHVSAVHHDHDLGDRGKEIGLFPLKDLQQPIKSLYGRPLVARDKFIGTMFLGSIKANAFNEYYRNFMDTLLNQVSMVVDNSVLHRRIRDMAHTDGLTGLLNHRTFMEKLDEEFKRLDRNEEQHFSLLLLDIDFFKKVNDEHGHPVGDVALKAIAGVVRETARSIDFVARYGGEEFAVGMVGADGDGAQKMAERIRRAVENKTITAGKIVLNRTLSIGVASYFRGCAKKETLISRADQALYRAKHSGRNRVWLFNEITDTDAAVAHSSEKR